MNAEHIQLMHLWRWGAFKILFIYIPLVPTCAPAQMRKGNTASVGGASPQKSICRCSACRSADLVRSRRWGENFPSSFLMPCPCSSCPILSLGTASCTQHSMVCPKEAETEQDTESEDLSPLSIKTVWKGMLFHQWSCRKLSLWQLLVLTVQVSTLLWWNLLLF